MTKVKVSDLIGTALDWAVASCLAEKALRVDRGYWAAVFARWGDYRGDTMFSSSWSKGGPIIEENRITLQYWKTGVSGYWLAFNSVTSASDYPIPSYQGETPLIAAMRCYVASKLGNEVDIPEELL